MRGIRRILALSLAIITLLCSVACQKTDTHSDDKSTQSSKEEDVIVTNTYEKTTVRLGQDTEGIKILGVRNLGAKAVINADWTCAGVEFYADCEGTLVLSVMAQSPCYYRAYVDGEPYMNGDTPYFTVENNTGIKIENIERGTHLFRFVKATGYTLAKTAIRSVTLCGLISKDAPKDNDLYLEFVGDSICCGWGVLANAAGEYNGTYNCQDGTLAYPYLISSELGADYSITALSGQGLSCGNPGMVLGYKYACYEKDGENEYAFDRKADAVIINIGTNDYSQREKLGLDSNKYAAVYEEFLRTVREKNGKDCKIILVFNVMNDTFAGAINLAFKRVGAEAAGYYMFQAERTAHERGNSHPSINENKKYAEKIGAFIKEVLDIK